MLAATVEARAEYSAVDGLIARLGGLQMRSIAAAVAGNYGLDKPAATVRVGSGSSQATLVSGGEAAEGTGYARDRARPAGVTVQSSLPRALRKAPPASAPQDLVDARPLTQATHDHMPHDKPVAPRARKPPTSARGRGGG